MFDVAPAFPNNPKDNDGEIQVTLTDAFPVNAELENAIDLGFGHERVLKKLPVFSLEKLLLLAFLFKWGSWTQESPGLTSAWSCWPRSCRGQSWGLEIAIASLRRSRERARVQYPATHSRSLSTVWRSFCEFRFSCADRRLVGWLACAGRSLGEGERDVQKPSWHWWALNLWFYLGCLLA